MEIQMRCIFNNCNKMSEFLIFTSLRTKSLQIFAEKILKEFPLDDYGPVSVILHEQTGSLDDIGNIYRDMIAVLDDQAIYIYTLYSVLSGGQKVLLHVRQSAKIFHTGSRRNCIIS